MKKYWIRHGAVLLGLIMVTAMLEACGFVPPLLETDSSGAGFGMSKDSYATEGAVSDDMVMEDAEYEASSNTVETQDAGDVSGTADAQTKRSKKLDRKKIIYHGSVTIETLDMEQTKKELYTLIDQEDAVIQSENEYYSDSDWYSGEGAAYRSLSITLRIPAESFHAFMDSVGETGSVTNRTTDATNVTNEYYDVSARLSSYKAEKEKLKELMEAATRMKDILQIEEKLSDLQYQIDSTQSRLDTIDLDVSYSTVDLYVREVERYTESGKTFVEQVKETLLGSLRFFLSFLRILCLGVLYLGPCAVVIVLILMGIRRLLKRWHVAPFRLRRKAKEKKDEEG